MSSATFIAIHHHGRRFNYCRRTDRPPDRQCQSCVLDFQLTSYLSMGERIFRLSFRFSMAVAYRAV